MKSSTIRRSTLSKESMEVIENLSKEQEDSSLPGEYVRPDEINNNENSGSMSQEIDLLWQNFKTNQFNTNTPAVYIFIGILIGVFATSLAFGIHHSIVSKGRSTTAAQAPVPTVESIINDKDNNQTSVTDETMSEQTIPSDENSTADQQNKTAETTAAQPVNETGESPVDTSNMTKYIVKSGDTIESIIKNHYGTYSPDKAEQIMQVNNMKSLDRINIDQEILLP